MKTSAQNTHGNARYARWRALRCAIVLAGILCTASMAQAQDAGLFRTDAYLSIARGSKLTWRLEYDRLVDSLRNVSLFVDSAVLADSMAVLRGLIGTGGGGRTYIRDQRATAHAGLKNIDSTGALYTLDWNFGTLNYQGYVSFSNTVAATNDSSHFQFNGLANYGFFVPVDVAYPIIFERAILKTSYGGSTDAPYAWSFVDNVIASPDSTAFSVHIKLEYVGGVRYYYVRVYKHYAPGVVGLVVPLASGTLVCSASVPADRFPPTNTSVQMRLDLWIRRH
jgi:hypothetical protein